MDLKTELNQFIELAGQPPARLKSKASLIVQGMGIVAAIDGGQEVPAECMGVFDGHWRRIAVAGFIAAVLRARYEEGGIDFSLTGSPTHPLTRP